MAPDDTNFVSPTEEEQGLDFYTDTAKGVIKESIGTGTGSGDNDAFGDRAVDAPENDIDENRDLVYTDPHVHEGVMTLVDWIVGDGYNLSGRSESEMGSTEANPTDGDTADLTGLLRNSTFWNVFVDWVRVAAIDGHAFMELVVEDGVFKPKILPTKEMKRQEDKFGELQFYKLVTPSGAQAESSGESGVGANEVRYEPHEVAELTFTKHPTDDFGRSLVAPIREQADMLRDMEIDYARFIATKAYPPILWRLGTEENQWTEDQISNWMDSVDAIGPDSMMAAPHDVETEIVGSTSTSSTAGAMRLEETFRHLENRVVTGLGVPRVLMNMNSDGQGEATATMPAFKRRVDRLQNRVKGAVEEQILQSLLTESADEERKIVPEFQFGEHSSAEKRLELDKLLKLFNNGLLTAGAFAERAGIDPEELPEMWSSGSHLENLQALAGLGDNVQNPMGGSPTDTEGGTDSSGGEVTRREGGEAGSDNRRNKQAVTEDTG